MGLAFSIIRRRRRSARRERLERDRDSLHTNGSEDTPHMIGPQPFVPRFFPGTILPVDPPPYVDSVSSAHSSSAAHDHDDQLQGPYTPRIMHPRDTSYADIPPSTPPPPDDNIMLAPPPPFGVAIATLLPDSPDDDTHPNTGRIGVLLPPGIAGAERDSHTAPSDVGAAMPDSALPPAHVSSPISIPASRSASQTNSVRSVRSGRHRDDGS